jgi:hypothetical protein
MVNLKNLAKSQLQSNCTNSCVMAIHLSYWYLISQGLYASFALWESTILVGEWLPLSSYMRRRALATALPVPERGRVPLSADLLVLMAAGTPSRNESGIMMINHALARSMMILEGEMHRLLARIALKALASDSYMSWTFTTCTRR